MALKCKRLRAVVHSTHAITASWLSVLQALDQLIKILMWLSHYIYYSVGLGDQWTAAKENEHSPQTTSQVITKWLLKVGWVRDYISSHCDQIDEDTMEGLWSNLEDWQTKVNQNDGYLTKFAFDIANYTQGWPQIEWVCKYMWVGTYLVPWCMLLHPFTKLNLL